jgi:hypothetical protein
LETRNAQTSLRYRYTHICAKINKFRFCVRILKQKCEHGSDTHHAIAKVFTICYAPCDNPKFKQNEKKKFLLSLPAARVGYMGRTSFGR